MAKLPKKSTMKDTIDRVKGYANKLMQADKITVKTYTDVVVKLNNLKKAIDK